MVVLEGSATLESDNFSKTYRKGDAFVVPKGLSWVLEAEGAAAELNVMID